MYILACETTTGNLSLLSSKDLDTKISRVKEGELVYLPDGGAPFRVARILGPEFNGLLNGLDQLLNDDDDRLVRLIDECGIATRRAMAYEITNHKK